MEAVPFGISPAPEEFQRYLDSALEGLEGVKGTLHPQNKCRS